MLEWQVCTCTHSNVLKGLPKKSISWDGSTNMFTFNLHQYHFRKEGLVHLSWCYYPKILTFKIQGHIFLASKAHNCRGREWGVGKCGFHLWAHWVCNAQGISGRHSLEHFSIDSIPLVGLAWGHGEAGPGKFGALRAEFWSWTDLHNCSSFSWNRTKILFNAFFLK